MANTTWNPADKSAGVTLSNSNLTASLTANSQGVRAIGNVVSGKYYFEVTATTWTPGLQCIVGIANSAAVLTSVGSVPNNACGVLNGGQIYLNGANASGNPTLGARANGDIIGTAADLDNKLVWFRVAPSGNWNGNAGFAPGGSGGVGFSSIGGSGVQFFPLVAETFAPAAFTANFGDAAFSGTTPAGFTAGWPTSSSGGAGTTQARAMVLA